MESFGHTMLGAFLGNKISSRGATVGPSMTQAAQQRTDVVQANATLKELEREKIDLQAEFQRERQELAVQYSLEALKLEKMEVPCRKGDIKVELLAIVWIPWQRSASGQGEPLVALPEQRDPEQES